MKMKLAIQFLIIVTGFTTQVAGQRDTFPLLYDYSVGLDVTYDIQGFCDCQRTVVRKDSTGMSWKRDGFMNCIYLDENKEQVFLEKVWVRSDVPLGPWEKEGKVKYGRIGEIALNREPQQIADTFQVFITYENEDRELVRSAPAECYCTGEMVASYSSSGQPGAIPIFKECEWMTYEFGRLSPKVKILVVEGFPVEEWVPDR